MVYVSCFLFFFSLRLRNGGRFFSSTSKNQLPGAGLTDRPTDEYIGRVTGWIWPVKASLDSTLVSVYRGP